MITRHIYILHPHIYMKYNESRKIQVTIYRMPKLTNTKTEMKYQNTRKLYSQFENVVCMCVHVFTIFPFFPFFLEEVINVCVFECYPSLSTLQCHLVIYLTECMLQNSPTHTSRKSLKNTCLVFCRLKRTSFN